MRQLSKPQWALLGVLLLHPRSLAELKKRWPFARRTIRACRRRGLVRTRGKGRTWIEITDEGLRYYGTPDQTQGLGTWERRP